MRLYVSAVLNSTANVPFPPNFVAVAYQISRGEKFAKVGVKNLNERAFNNAKSVHAKNFSSNLNKWPQKRLLFENL